MVRAKVKQEPGLATSPPGSILVSGGMKLTGLFAGADLRRPIGNADAEISSLAYNSLQVAPGALFVALRGVKTDGNRFVFDAIQRGARAIASELPRPWSPQWASLFASETATPHDVPPSVEWIEVADARKALATAAANFFRRPAETLKLVGVTGTNGKTTTTYLIDSIVRAAGHAAGLFGTIAYRTPRSNRVATNTTPESLELQSFLAEVRDAGGTYAVLEASSHALAMDRVWGCKFAVAVFTNLTRDHLDYHKTFEDYFAAKRRLLEGTGRGAPALAVVNTDDPYGKRLKGLAARTLTYGLENGAEVTTRKFSLSFAGLEFTAQTPSGRLEVRSPLVGRINVYNILAAIGAALGLGIAREAIVAGIRSLGSVPGRFERIDQGQPFLLVVDYAHTDDALRNLIATARELNPAGRIITLFGCGGDRDRAKRPLMGEVAGNLSDLVVLTSDNPRSEDPLRIINDVVVGVQKTKARYVIEPDRAVAVERAIGEARSGDIVLLAGKGHETYQVLRDRTIDFDDREVARRLLRLRGYGG
jgi:UDP-N-acetylmuramoyl-L-alanyl-D-glutamate--2,6-diaminopimelate ligase